MIHVLKEITAMQELIERLKRELDTTRAKYDELIGELHQTIAELRTECGMLIEERDKAETENARLRALLNAQDEYAHSGAYIPLVKTEFMGDGD